MSPPEWPNIDDLSEAECALFMRGYRLGLLAGEQDATAVLTEARCDWEHGVCLCPGCGAVVQVVARAGRPPRVTDGDGREHVCQRQIAAVLAAHGEPGMGPVLRRHAERLPLVRPGVAPVTPPGHPPAPWERWP